MVNVARVVGALLGWVAGSVLRIRRAHVEGAMRVAGVRNPARAARAMYRALGASLVEFLAMAWGGRVGDGVVRLAAVEEGSREAWRAVRATARARGTGLVLAASHTGNWDLAACAIAGAAGEGVDGDADPGVSAGAGVGVSADADPGAGAGADLPPVDLLVVTKHLRVRWLDRIWQSTRARFGVRLTGANGALAAGKAALRRGGAVAMMIDQVPDGRHGVAVDFLGARAWADRATAALAAATGAPLVVTASRRVASGRHALLVLDVMWPPPRAARAWIDEATRRATAALDAFVRAHPDQWLWLHRRWREPRGVRLADEGRAVPRLASSSAAWPDSARATLWEVLSSKDQEAAVRGRCRR